MIGSILNNEDWPNTGSLHHGPGGKPDGFENTKSFLNTKIKAKVVARYKNILISAEAAADKVLSGRKKR